MATEKETHTITKHVIELKATKYRIVGSSKIFGAEAKDTDILILSNRNPQWILDYVNEHNTNYGDQYDLEEFVVLKDNKNKIDFIIADKEDFFNKFVAAQKLAEQLELTNKDDRITLFRYVLYGEEPIEV